MLLMVEASGFMDPKPGALAPNLNPQGPKPIDPIGHGTLALQSWGLCLGFRV